MFIRRYSSRYKSECKSIALRPVTSGLFHRDSSWIMFLLVVTAPFLSANTRWHYPTRPGGALLPTPSRIFQPAAKLMLPTSEALRQCSVKTLVRNWLWFETNPIWTGFARSAEKNTDNFFACFRFVSLQVFCSLSIKMRNIFSSTNFRFASICLKKFRSVTKH